MCAYVGRAGFYPGRCSDDHSIATTKRGRTLLVTAATP